jgi:RNA polymerase sigma-70 factor (ECF subfamily)
MTESQTSTGCSVDPDALLLRRYAATGDRQAFETLFRKYQGPIFALVHRMVGDEDAYDLTQEVFLRVLRSIETFRAASSFRTWLYTIARNVCYNYCRDQKRKKSYETDNDFNCDGDDQLADNLPDPYLNVERIAEERELQRAAIMVLATLSEEQRMIISLRDFEGMSYEEIGQIMELSVANVKSKLHRARITFKKAFTPYMSLLDDYFQE